MENPFIVKGEPVKRHVDWTPKGEALSDEEKEKVIEEMDRKVREDARDLVVIPRSQMKLIAESLNALCSIGKMELNDWLELPETKQRKLMMDNEAYQNEEFNLKLNRYDLGMIALAFTIFAGHMLEICEQPDAPDPDEQIKMSGSIRKMLNMIDKLA